MSIGFGGKYFPRPSPLWVKLIWYVLLGIMVHFFVNIDSSPLEEGSLKSWLKFFASAIVVALNFLKDNIGVKTINDKVEEKKQQT